MEGTKGQGQHFHVRGADLVVGLNVLTPPVIDVHADPTNSPFTGFLCAVSPDDGEVIQVHLSIWCSLVQPCLRQDDDRGLIVGSLHSTFGMEYINFIPERPYV